MEKTINAHMLDHLNDPELPDLVKTYQVHAHCRTSWNTTRMNVPSLIVGILLRR